MIIFTMLLCIACSTGTVFSQKSTTEPVLKKAGKLRAEGKLKEAVSELKDVIKRTNRNAAAYNLLGEIYVELENYEYYKLADRAFDMALRIEPDHPVYLSNYGNLKIKMKEYSRAERLFNRAIKKAPDYYGGYHGIANLYVDTGSDRYLYKVEDFLSGKIDTTTSYEYLLDHGRILTRKEKTNEALEIFTRMANMFPDDPLVKLSLSDLYRKIQDFERASHFYLTGLKDLKNEKELEKRYTFMKDLFTADERSYYKSLSLKEKVNYLLDFWKKNDPNLMTELNERLVEHFKRVEYALTFYRAGVFPGYDDRGMIYIRYGPPDSKFVSSAGNNVTFQGFGQMGVIQTRPNESWVYNSLHTYLSFDFVEYGNFYKLAHDLRDAIVNVPNVYMQMIATWDLNVLDPKLIAAKDLYRERSSLSPHYARLGYFDFSGPSQLYNFVQSSNDFTSMQRQARDDVPTEVFKPEFDFRPINVAISYAQFRGKENKTDLEIYLGIYANEDDFLFEEGKKIAPYNNKIVLLDSSFNRTENTKKEYSITLSPEANTNNIVGIFQEDLSLLPGKKNIGLQIDSDKNKRGGIYSINLELKDFTKEKLMVSDIQFSDYIVPVNSEEIASKHGLKINVYPFKSISKRKPIYAYYEIYNLTFDKNGKSRYQIEYSVRQTNTEGNLITRGIKGVINLFGGDQEKISTSYSRTGDSTTAYEYIRFNMEEISEGSALLVVTITDLNSGSQAVSEKEFIIEK